VSKSLIKPDPGHKKRAENKFPPSISYGREPTKGHREQHKLSSKNPETPIQLDDKRAASRRRAGVDLTREEATGRFVNCPSEREGVRPSSEEIRQDPTSQ